jgi:hypothetical protein
MRVGGEVELRCTDLGFGTSLSTPWHAGFYQCGWRAAERRHPTGRERMGHANLRTLQDPILLKPWLRSRQTLTLVESKLSARSIPG